MSVPRDIKNIFDVRRIIDYSEPLKEKQLHNRAVLFSATMSVIWGLGMYKAHVRHFAEPIQIFVLLLGIMLILSVIYSALVKARAHHGAASQAQLWKAWRLQQCASGIAFVGVFVLFLSWHIAHW